MNLEHKALNCEFKAAGDDGSFELYALAFNNVDRQGDLIVPGAVSNTAELVSDGWGALNHMNSALPVAYPESATQDAKGLLVRGKFHSHPDAQAVRTVVTERMAAGKAVPCSIGYAVDDASYETRNGDPIRILKSIRVYEFSFVNLPANPAAAVVSAKSIDPPEAGSGWFEKVAEKVAGLLGWEAKKGRVVSAANHAKLAAAHGKIEEGTSAIRAFIAEHDPSRPADDRDGDGKAADPLAQLRRRALEGRRMARCP
jgi:HK97 family phage prohead protease